MFWRKKKDKHKPKKLDIKDARLFLNGKELIGALEEDEIKVEIETVYGFTIPVMIMGGKDDD